MLRDGRLAAVAGHGGKMYLSGDVRPDGLPANAPTVGAVRVLFQCMPPLHPAVRARWVANTLAFLAGTTINGVH